MFLSFVYEGKYSGFPYSCSLWGISIFTILCNVSELCKCVCEVCSNYAKSPEDMQFFQKGLVFANSHFQILVTDWHNPCQSTSILAKQSGLRSFPFFPIKKEVAIRISGRFNWYSISVFFLYWANGKHQEREERQVVCH